MKTYSIPVLLILLSLVIACDGTINPFLPIIRPPADQLTWVAHFYSGGRQCNPFIEYDPPNVQAVLCSVGIVVFETIIEPYLTCHACDCPAYAAMHYALILKTDLARAVNIGFEERNPPDYLYE